MKDEHIIKPGDVNIFLGSVFGEDMHAKRVQSLADATLGVLNSASLGVHCIGHGLAAARDLVDKHAIKQVDRLLSNDGIDIKSTPSQWVPFAIGGLKDVFVNLDWTEFDSDDQSMVVLSMQSHHGRSVPLMWKTVVKSKLKDRRNAHEDELLLRFCRVVPEGVHVTIVADRGFADTKLFKFLKCELGFDYIIRFKSLVHVTDSLGETRKAGDWTGMFGRMRVLRNAYVTCKDYPVATVVCLKAAGMKEAWCIVASDPRAHGRDLVRRYGKRFTIEEMFRDLKDLRYGMGMSWRPISKPERRDRMFLVAVLAQALLTLLGEAGEQLGLDRQLKANTARKRTLSLLRQGMMWYDHIPTMREERLRPLMIKFTELLTANDPFRSIFCRG